MGGVMHDHSITSSVIIFVVHLFYITARKAKRHAPVAADFDGPNTLALTLQFVRCKPRQIHVLRTLGLIEVRENQPQSFSVLRLNAGLAAGVVKARQPFVGEALNHQASVAFCDFESQPQRW